MSVRSHAAFKKELLKNKEFREAYQVLGPEFVRIETSIIKRIKRNRARTAVVRKPK